MKDDSLVLALCALFSICLAGSAERPQVPPVPLTVLRAGRVLDITEGSYKSNIVVAINADRIVEVTPQTSATLDGNIIDLRELTLLPGLIDCHTHLMARLASTDEPYYVQLATKSQAYRALEGAANARETLLAGFTTVRDVGNEGAGFADVALREAIKNGLIDGPRMLVSTKAIAALGQYLPFGISSDLKDFPTGSQMISGVEEARRAVREQIARGADLIKLYADWETPTLTRDELAAIVEEAHKLRRKVAAHATTREGIRNAVESGVDSIEHGNDLDREVLKSMRERGTFLVFTAGICFSQFERTTNPSARAYLNGAIASMRRNLASAKEIGVKIAGGMDAGEAFLQGKNFLQLEAMVKLGMSPLEAIRSQTIDAADLLGLLDQVGSIQPGRLADVIAVRGNPLENIADLSRVEFVMKGGKIFKKPSREL
jgi:imidazolonepropionase-like amidohydrolase